MPAIAIARLCRRLGAVPAPIVGVLKAIESHVAWRPHLRWIRAGGRAQGRNVRLVTVEEVGYLEADNDYMLRVTEDGESLISKPIKRLPAKIDPADVRSTHRSGGADVIVIALGVWAAESSF